MGLQRVGHDLVNNYTHISGFRKQKWFACQVISIKYILLSLFLKYIYYLFFAVLGPCCCTRAFSSCSVQGLLFVVVCGFSLWWFLLLWSTQAQWVWGTGSAAPWHVGSSWTRDRTHVLCIGRQNLKHRLTTEVSCCSWLTSTTKEGPCSRLLPRWAHSHKVRRAVPVQDPHCLSSQQKPGFPSSCSLPFSPSPHRHQDSFSVGNQCPQPITTLGTCPPGQLPHNRYHLTLCWSISHSGQKAP